MFEVRLHCRSWVQLLLVPSNVNFMIYVKVQILPSFDRFPQTHMLVAHLHMTITLMHCEAKWTAEIWS